MSTTKSGWIAAGLIWLMFGTALALPAGLLGLYAAGLLLGGMTGGGDPFKPLGQLHRSTVDVNAAELGTAGQSANFITVTTVDELDELIRTRQQPTVVKIFAKWCTSCRTLERTVFSKPIVQDALRPYLRIKFDMTDSDAATNKWLRAQQVVGPPALLFYPADPALPYRTRLVGEVSQTAVLRAAQSI